MNAAMDPADAAAIILDAVQDDRGWAFPAAEEYFPVVANGQDEMFLNAPRR